jgi:hypothetical protein
MTPQAKTEAGKILDSYKSGEASKEAAVFMLQELFKREPVNYKKAPTVTADDGQ